MKKIQLFRLTQDYPHSSIYPDASKEAAEKDFRSKLVTMREWPWCGEHYPHGLPIVGKVEVMTYKPYKAKYVLTLECPECQHTNRVFTLRW